MNTWFYFYSEIWISFFLPKKSIQMVVLRNSNDEYKMQKRQCLAESDTKYWIHLAVFWLFIGFIMALHFLSMFSLCLVFTCPSLSLLLSRLILFVNKSLLYNLIWFSRFKLVRVFFGNVRIFHVPLWILIN